jgi:hypothetical protein
MTQPASPLPSSLVDTPWPGCAGLRANAIDGAAALIIMEVLIEALARLPDGPSALAESCGRRAARRGPEPVGATATEIAANALAMALIEAARDLEESPAVAA